MFWSPFIGEVGGTFLGFEMVAGSVVIHQSIPVLDVQYRCTAKEIEGIVNMSAAAAAPSSPAFRQAERGLEAAAAAAVDLTVPEMVGFKLFFFQLCSFLGVYWIGIDVKTHTLLNHSSWILFLIHHSVLMISFFLRYIH